MEQMIIFVYDTGYCRTEADDPQKAVLFFHPHWVSDQQRLALCGQLMGAAHFCSSVFSCPRVLTLQCGKFVLKKFGRYILSVGSDQSLSEWILQERFNMLELLVQFYHNNFDALFSDVECNQETFSKKLTEILEVYIPILQFIVSSLGNVFVVRCPKRSSTAFLEAFQLLEACCNFKGVLGGVVLHNSKVLATQLDPDITKLLALTDRFHMRTCAERIVTPFHLPVGVQLLKVYLKQKVYESLRNAVNLKFLTFNGVQKNNLQKVGMKKKEESRIFTVHEEEDSIVKTKNASKETKEMTRNKGRKPKPKNEPTALKERSKSFVGGLNIKVCSTPTVEKTVIHEELVSICSSGGGKTEQQPAFVPDVVRAMLTKNRTKYSSEQFRRMSVDDLMIDSEHKAFPLPLRYYFAGQLLVCREAEQWDERSRRRKRFCKTIADPMNPVFRNDGAPVSKFLYNCRLDSHYRDFVAANMTIDSREEFLKNKYLERKVATEETTEKKGAERQESGKEESKVGDKENSVEEKSKEPAENKTMVVLSENQRVFRRSLSLPLKPLCETALNVTQNCGLKNKVLLCRTPTTPLTTKLSLLTFEEKIDQKPLGGPIEICHLKNLVKNVVATGSNDRKDYRLGTDGRDGQSGDTVPSSLFVCAHQNMTILLVLDENVEKNPDLILSLWEVSSETLKKVENVRNKSLTQMTTISSSSSYSFLSMDSHWGTLQRSGPWAEEELKVIGSIHNDMVKAPKMTEIIVRNEDSVVYGYSCGGSKIFYRQSGCSGAGLPTPADLMGVVTLKARRRLERDRDIILL